MRGRILCSGLCAFFSVACEASVGGSPILGSPPGSGPPGSDPDGPLSGAHAPSGSDPFLTAGTDHVASSPAEPSDVDSTQRYWDFWRPDHVAQWTDDGLTYVDSVGPYGVFQVTSPNARLIAPHLGDGARGDRHIMICSSWYMFLPEGTEMSLDDGAPMLDLVNIREEEIVVQKVMQAIQGGCSYPSDVGTPYDGPVIVDLAMQVDPPPPEGTIVAIARISMDDSSRDYHQEDSLPPICCGACDPAVNEYCPAPGEVCELGGVWTPPNENESAWHPVEIPAS